MQSVNLYLHEYEWMNWMKWPLKLITFRQHITMISDLQSYNWWQHAPLAHSLITNVINKHYYTGSLSTAQHVNSPGEKRTRDFRYAYSVSSTSSWQIRLTNSCNRVTVSMTRFTRSLDIFSTDHTTSSVQNSKSSEEQLPIAVGVGSVKS